MRGASSKASSGGGSRASTCRTSITEFRPRPDEPGIDGGIGTVGDAPLSAGRPLVTLTMPVPSLDECIAGIQANGDRVVEPRVAIPGIGWYATCAEPGGLMFGIIESDLSVA